MLPLARRIFARRRLRSTCRHLLAQEVENFSWGVGGERVECEGGNEFLIGAGGYGESLLEVLLALLFDFEQLEEELLRVGAHLRSSAGFYPTLDQLPIFSEGHKS